MQNMVAIRCRLGDVLNLRGYEALSNLDLDRAQVLYTASHELAVELGDRGGQAENLLALGHIHLLHGDNEEAAQALQENRSLLEQLNDHHQLAHADQAFALLAISTGREADGEALFQDVARRLGEMGLTMMGGTYALGIADLYRQAGRRNLASALLRHAMTVINPTIQSAEYARAQQEARSTDGDCDCDCAEHPSRIHGTGRFPVLHRTARTELRLQGHRSGSDGEVVNIW